MSVCKLISTLTPPKKKRKKKRRKVQAGNEWSNILPKILASDKKAPMQLYFWQAFYCWADHYYCHCYAYYYYCHY